MANVSVMTEFTPSEIFMELDARMSATLMGRGVRAVNDKLFDGYGPVGKYRIKRSEKAYETYKKNAAGDKNISGDLFYDDPDIEKYYDENRTLAMRQDVFSRGYAGYSCAVHVFAYFNGLETLYGEGWPEENKRCTNMICRALGLPEMYKGLSDDGLTQLDYSIDGPKTRPIVTLNMMKRAYSEFPFELALPHISKTGIEEKPMNKERTLEGQKVVRFLETGKGEATSMPDNSVIEVGPEGISEVVTTKEVRGRRLMSRIQEMLPKKEEALAKEKSAIEKAADVAMQTMRGVKANSDARKQKLQKAINEATEGILLPGDTIVLTVDDDSEKLQAPAVVKEKKAPESPIFEFTKMTLDLEDREPSSTEKGNVTKVFGPFLKNKEYQLNRSKAGALELVINDGLNYPSYWIDPNLCAGNGYNVLGNVLTNDPFHPVDTILVHESEKEILEKVFSDRMYILSPEEVQKCMGHMFLNQKIYNVVDMSNMKTNLKKLKQEQFSKLGKKLTFIINSLSEQQMGRFRFEYFHGVDDFMLVSDSKARSPFPGQTLNEASGCIVTVRSDAVAINFNGSCLDLTIEEYGVI